MAPELQNFEIILDSPQDTFSPGDIVAGRVIVVLGKAKSIIGLTIRFKGKGMVRWRDSTGFGEDETTTHYSKNEDYFRMESCLLKAVDDSERIEIEAGCHVFPFKFSLPHNIPSSFQHCEANVRYTIKATMDGPWIFNHHTVISLTVQAPYDVIQNPASKLAIQDEKYKTFGFFPFKKGSISLEIFVPVSGFAVGEIIETTLAINNKSASVHVTKIALQLKQKIKLYATSGTKRTEKIIQKAEKLGPFNKKDVIAVGMQVPTAPPSGFPHCSIIHIEYLLVVQVNVSGCYRRIETVYPILIGTTSTLSSQSMESAYVIPPRPKAPVTVFLEDSATEEPPPSYNTCTKMKM